MSSFIGVLLSLLLLYKYLALAIFVFTTSIILPLPTNSVLLATGAFASQGYFNFFISLGVIMLANVTGDCVDFFLARRYGRPALHMLRVHIPTYIERLEQYVRQHPGPTIFFTRFVGTIECLTSLLAGFVGISWTTFLLYDILGNLVSNGIVLYAGYFLGVHWQDFTGLFNIVGYILAAVLIMAALAVALWYRHRRRA
jgi:membrane protein DedA with SNARE-associated domain